MTLVKFQIFPFSYGVTGHVCCFSMWWEVVGDNHSHAPIYVQQWGIVVLHRYLVLLVLAALVIMCWLYVCIVGLDRHLELWSA